MILNLIEYAKIYHQIFHLLQVFTSAYLSAKYIKIKYPEVKKVYVIGAEGIVKELEAEGIIALGSDEDKDKIMTIETFDKMELDPEIGAVVHFHYSENMHSIPIVGCWLGH